MVNGFILVNGSQVQSVPPNTAIQYVAQGVGNFGSVHFMVLNKKTAETVLNKYVDERFNQAWLDQASPYQPGEYVFFPDADNAPGVNVAFTVSPEAPMPVNVGGNPLQRVGAGISSVTAPVTKVATDILGSVKWPLIALSVVAVVGGIIYLKGSSPRKI